MPTIITSLPGAGGIWPLPLPCPRPLCRGSPRACQLSAVFIMNEPGVTVLHFWLLLQPPDPLSKGMIPLALFYPAAGEWELQPPALLPPPQPALSIGCPAAPTHGCPSGTGHGPDTLSKPHGRELMGASRAPSQQTQADTSSGARSRGGLCPRGSLPAPGHPTEATPAAEILGPLL